MKKDPEYRIINVSVYGNASNMAWRYNDHPLPLSHLDKKLRIEFINLNRDLQKERESLKTDLSLPNT